MNLSDFQQKFDQSKYTEIQPYKTYMNGALFHQDSIEWLKSIKSESIDLIFADPPYNIKKASWDSFNTMDDYIDWSINWIKEASRVLKPTGTLYVCGFTEILADIKRPAMQYFTGCKWLIWSYLNKGNMSNDWGRSHESIIHFRKGKKFTMNIDDIRIPYGAHTLKYPSHPSADTTMFGRLDTWSPNPLGAKPKDVIQIPTTCNGMGEKTPHPTQKPEELLRKLVLASSNENDIVLDPFLGSGTTAVVAEQLNRKWLGCDLSEDYLSWADNRIIHVVRRTIREWIDYDRKNKERRESIR